MEGDISARRTVECGRKFTVVSSGVACSLSRSVTPADLTILALSLLAQIFVDGYTFDNMLRRSRLSTEVQNRIGRHTIHTFDIVL